MPINTNSHSWCTGLILQRYAKIIKMRGEAAKPSLPKEFSVKCGVQLR